MSNDLQDEYKNDSISNEDMVNMAKKQYESKQLSDYKFPTEVIDLPSNGLIYPKENPLSSGKVEMKYMTAKEEDILTTQSYIKDGSVLDRLFQSLIISNGEGAPIKYVDLTIGDKNAIMIAARVLGYGKDYVIELDDSFSDNKQKETIDLTQFENKAYDGSNQTEPHKNEFEFQLPHSKRVITFMAMTESKERKVKHQVEELMKAGRKIKDVTSRELTTRLKNIILSVDGETDTKTISNFVDNELFAMDSKALRNYINEVVPDIDLNWEFVSDETWRKEDDATALWALAFFGLRLDYRQQLHSHIFDLIYHGNGGFTFSDVYNMPVWARKFYIQKIVDFKQAEHNANESHMQKMKQKGKR